MDQVSSIVIGLTCISCLIAIGTLLFIFIKEIIDENKRR
jgi:hypothetical protein